MRITVTVTVTKDQLAAITGKMKGKAALAVKKAAFDITAHAKDRSPYETGLLKGSIHPEEAGELQWVVSTNVHYAAYQEYGTSHGVPPHPYMTPAAEAVRPSFEAAMKAIKQVAEP